jgi:hypothetical protein
MIYDSIHNQEMRKQTLPCRDNDAVLVPIFASVRADNESGETGDRSGDKSPPRGKTAGNPNVYPSKQNLSRGRVEKLKQLILLCALLSGCSHLVKISYPPEAVINPAFDQPTMNWEGERVQVVLTPSLQGEGHF